MTTPFDDPQAELAWMFLQCLSDGGDIDECFGLLSDDFTYWSIQSRESVDKAALRREFERRKRRVKMDLDFIQCFNDGESVVIEALTDGETSDGIRYNSPVGLHLRDPRRAHHVVARIRRHPTRCAGLRARLGLYSGSTVISALSG